MRLLASELRLQRTSLLVWVLAVAALMVLIVAVYPSIRGDDSLNAIYANLPPSAQGLLGGSDLTSPVGYLNTQVFAFFLPAVLLVFALSRGAATIAGEEEAHTLDLLLAQPLPRAAAYVQKAAALAVALVLLGLATAVPVLALDGAVRLDLGADRILAVCGQMTLFTLALGLAAQAVATAAGRRAVGAAAVAGYAFVSYLVYGLAPSAAWAAHLRPLSPWRWYLGNDPLSSGWGLWEVLVLALVALVAVGAGALAFRSRDLRA